MMKLTIANIAFERNYQFLFSQINCVLNSGEILQVRGVNGSGKSTLLRILSGFIEPHHGTVLWQEQSIFRYRDAYQQFLHYVGHLNGTKSNLTVHENLKLNAALTRSKINSLHLQAILKKMGLTHIANIQAQHLSAGQLRRVSLARLLLHPTPLWILDEPTTALDTEGQELLCDLLNQHVANNGIAIVATHQNLALHGITKTLHLEVHSP